MNVPEPVRIKDNVVYIASGYYVIRTDGSLWAWRVTSQALFGNIVGEWVQLLDSGVSAIVDDSTGVGNLTIIRTDGKLQRLYLSQVGNTITVSEVETIMENVEKAVLR